LATSLLRVTAAEGLSNALVLLALAADGVHSGIRIREDPDIILMESG